MSGLLPATFTAQAVDGLADTLMIRRARQRAQENQDSADAWRDYANQLEERCQVLRGEVDRLSGVAKQYAAQADALRNVEARVSFEGAQCPHHEHHKISANPSRRAEVYNEELKISSQKRGAVFEPVAVPKAKPKA